MVHKVSRIIFGNRLLNPKEGTLGLFDRLFIGWVRSVDVTKFVLLVDFLTKHSYSKEMKTLSYISVVML